MLIGKVVKCSANEEKKHVHEIVFSFIVFTFGCGFASSLRSSQHETRSLSLSLFVSNKMAYIISTAASFHSQSPCRQMNALMAFKVLIPANICDSLTTTTANNDVYQKLCDSKNDDI